MAKPRKAGQLEVVGETRDTRQASTATFNERAKAFFRDRFGVQLSDEDLRETVQQLTAFFDLLNEWDKREAEKQGGRNHNDD